MIGQESFSVAFISEFLYAMVDLVNLLIYAILDFEPIPRLFYDLVEIFSSTILKSTSEKSTTLLFRSDLQEPIRTIIV